jgi:hypothetical protein
VEVNVYSTAKADGELVWTGTINGFGGNDAMKVIKQLVKIVAKELEKAEIVVKQSK